VPCLDQDHMSGEGSSKSPIILFVYITPQRTDDPWFLPFAGAQTRTK